MKRLLSGIKPTGALTLGNYVGAISQFVKMQSDYESYVFVADLHALTVYNDPEELKRRTRDIIAIYLASGLDPEKTCIFLQSDNIYITALSWVFECNTGVGQLSRMTQFKEKSNNKESVSCGLFTYPDLMASDILMYDADVVPVGIDQKQHVELARDIAEHFNSLYGDTFKIPEPVIDLEKAKIYDLQNPTKKMSKTSESDKGCISLLDDPEIARKKIMSAVTDSDMEIKYDKEAKPGISNLITIYSALNDLKIEDVCTKFKGYTYGEFKKEVADSVTIFLTELQSKYEKIINSDIIDKILEESNKKILALSKEKIKDVYKKIGIGLN